MTDKERLEKIQERLHIAKAYYDEGYRNSMGVIMGFMFEEGDVHWLIEQAERLHGTKGKYGYKEMHVKCNSDYATLNSKAKQLEEQNKRYREAIEGIQSWVIKSNVDIHLRLHRIHVISDKVLEESE